MSLPIWTTSWSILMTLWSTNDMSGKYYRDFTLTAFSPADNASFTSHSANTLTHINGSLAPPHVTTTGFTTCTLMCHPTLAPIAFPSPHCMLPATTTPLYTSLPLHTTCTLACHPTLAPVACPPPHHVPPPHHIPLSHHVPPPHRMPPLPPSMCCCHRALHATGVRYIIPLLYMQQWCLSFILYE